MVSEKVSQTLFILFNNIFFCEYAVIYSQSLIYELLLPDWASLVAQLVKSPPIIQETLIRFLGRENPLENG